VQIAYNILLTLAMLMAVLLVLVVFFTGKGDAMSGGSSGVRTSFKGKASFEDKVGQLTWILGGGFMVFVVILGVISNKL
jgi:preprotein translocase subunit SecG